MNLLHTVLPAFPAAIEAVFKNLPQNWLLICRPTVFDALGIIRQSKPTAVSEIPFAP
jgi:hypothetical protein